jgi:hypothetical protein
MTSDAASASNGISHSSGKDFPEKSALKEGAKDGRNFFDRDPQAQVALLQLGVQFVIRSLWAFQKTPDISLMLGKPLGVGMARVTPVAKQPLPARGNTPKQPAILQLGVFLKMNTIHKHSLNISRQLNQAIPPAGPNPHGHGREVHYVSTWARANPQE